MDYRARPRSGSPDSGCKTADPAWKAYLALFPRLLARVKAPGADAVLGAGTGVPANSSCEFSTHSTRKENPLLGDYPALPSKRKAPLWCRRSPNL
jgi:hypothetical protein